MTAVATQAGAVSHKQVDWHAINWQKVNRNVRRLQARIVQAVKAVSGETGIRKGSSGVKRKFYAPFQGGLAGLLPPGYPASGGQRAEATRESWRNPATRPAPTLQRNKRNERRVNKMKA